MGNLTFYGIPFKNRVNMLRELYDAQEALAKITPRMCLKWCELRISLFNILPIFDKWSAVFAQPYKKQKWKSGLTWWVKLVRR